MSDPFDEFSFLPEQAAEAGIRPPLPRSERLSMTLASGHTVSALRYRPAIGADDAVPVVTFLHGAGLNAHTWDTTILALGLPALAIDLPGHGDSSWRDDFAYAGRVLAPDVEAAMDAWTDGDQLLVGHSLGGLTAAAVAASRPDLVRHLALIDITPGVDPNEGPTQIREFFAGPTDWASRDELVERALSFGLGGSRRDAERGVYLNSRVRSDGRIEWKHHFAHLASAMAEQNAVSPVLSETGWDDLAAVSAAITLVRGDHGYVTEHNAEQFRARLPAASILVVEAGHNVHEERPLELAALLAERAGND